MANDMSALYAAGQNVSSNNNRNRSQDELVYNVNAHAFFLAFGEPIDSCEHQFFIKRDGKTPLDGFRWSKPFYGSIKEVYIGKNLAAEGIGLAELAEELENEETTFEIHIRKGSDEAYLSKPRSRTTGSAAKFFKD